MILPDIYDVIIPNSCPFCQRWYRFFHSIWKILCSVVSSFDNCSSTELPKYQFTNLILILLRRYLKKMRREVRNTWQTVTEIITKLRYSNILKISHCSSDTCRLCIYKRNLVSLQTLEISPHLKLLPITQTLGEHPQFYFNLSTQILDKIKYLVFLT